jgi:glycosyltransferase involved in cell wall biosynthesis
VNLDRISVVVTSFNEAHNIARCLESARGFGEVIVVDSFSADTTAEIARARASVVYQRAYASPPDQKNWAAARAHNDWVLVLDADEALDETTRAEIAALDPGSRAGFWIRRRSDYLGRTIRGCGWQREKVLRLYDKNRGHYPDAWVHEEVELEGDAGWLSGRLRHTPYRDVEQHVAKIDAYTTRGARQYVERGGRAALFNMLVHPPFRFLRMYVLQGGVRDGYPGLVLCLLSSYSVFLKYAKAWERLRGR